MRFMETFGTFITKNRISIKIKNKRKFLGVFDCMFVFK
jgi:hypothetical protein